MIICQFLKSLKLFFKITIYNVIGEYQLKFITFWLFIKKFIISNDNYNYFKLRY